MPRSNSAAQRDIAAQLHPYTNLAKHETDGPLIIARGQGVHVWDDQGKEYIEGLAGLWCVSLGYGEKRLIEAAKAQMEKLAYYHLFNSKSHETAIELAERILALMPVPMSKVFFNNSGSEANDTAIKIIWYYNNAIGRPKKKKLISRQQGYHGVTVATASLTGLPNNHRDFDLPIANILFTDCPHHYRFANPGESEEDFSTRLAANLDALIEREGPDTVAAFFAEPVMGAGGVIVPPRTYFEKIQAVLKKHDVMLVADEVICGFGRTGNMFGSETFGMKPDIMTMAKALSSGYVPISATVVSEAIYQVLKQQSVKIGVFAHGFTYSGHPVPAAVAVETLKIYEERDILSQIRKVSPRLQDGLRRFAAHPNVGEVRGVGLIAGLEMVADKKTKQRFDAKLGAGALLAARAQANGLIVRVLGGDGVAICPPLVISEAEIDELLSRLGKALDETAERLTA
ncbi:MAG TPA: aspartate aminotransferase family protein [Stellaceae bacterium]